MRFAKLYKAKGRPKTRQRSTTRRARSAKHQNRGYQSDREKLHRKGGHVSERRHHHQTQARYQPPRPIKGYWLKYPLSETVRPARAIPAVRASSVPHGCILLGLDKRWYVSTERVTGVPYWKRVNLEPGQRPIGFVYFRDPRGNSIMCLCQRIRE